jgi:hypothetical protein
MVNNHINAENSPICYLVYNFSFLFGEGRNIYELFLKNSFPSDAVIPLTKHIKQEATGVKNFQFNIDHRLTNEQLKGVLNAINPGAIYSYQTNYELDNEIIVEFDNINYESAYIIAGKDFKIRGEKYLIDIVKENENLYLTISDSLPDSKKTEHDKFEEDLDHILGQNNMKINELYTKGNRIEIRITGGYSESISEVIIDEIDIQITCDNSKDLGFLNNLFHMLFK